MNRLEEVRVGVHALERFEDLIGADRLREAMATAAWARRSLSKRVFWNLNSTAVGGGVAEMLQTILGYTRGIGIDTRWMVISAEPEFFRITKRLHHALHGSSGDGSELGERERHIYEETLRENAVELAPLLRPNDIVLLHDPQTAGIAPHLRNSGVHVIWRCHIGQDHSNEEVDYGWQFLCPYLEDVPVFIFTRQTYVPEMCHQERSVIIQPSIDAFCAKNEELSEARIRTILVHTGLVEGPLPEDADHTFLRDDGTPGRVERRADIVRLGRPPAWETPLVVQISRWDPLKDMQGVMEGFARLVNGSAPANAELVLAGPNVSGVADDPEGSIVYEEVVEAWRALPHAVRNRVHLVSLPTADVQENAVIVNALQRHATVVVQKSLQEGFGLTVTEAMWKGRPVLASAVGGIQDQIEDGASGVLLKDPADLDDFAEALGSLLENPEYMRRLGEAARERVRDNFLGVDHLLKYAEVIRRFDES